jgi:hypothetical protein
MAIEYEMHVEGDILYVTTSGFDETLEEVMDYGTAVQRAAREKDCPYILVDETDLQYRLSTIDTYDLAKYYAYTFRDATKVALVTNEENMEDAKFWETAVVNRGLSYRVFSSKEEARAWLKVDAPA